MLRTTIEESLKTISLIEPGQKLSIAYGNLRIVNNPNSIIRWLKGDGKMVTIAYIFEIIKKAKLENIPIDPKTISGLENLKITYHKYDKMVLMLTELQEEII